MRLIGYKGVIGRLRVRNLELGLAPLPTCISGHALCQPGLYPNQTSGNERQSVSLEWHLALIDITVRGSQG